MKLVCLAVVMVAAAIAASAAGPVRAAVDTGMTPPATSQPKQTRGTVTAQGSELASPAAVVESPVVNYSGYQGLLDTLLIVASPPGQPLETRFSYFVMFAQKDHEQRFMRIRHQMFEVSPSKLSRHERLAWAINAYNYLVIETITKNLFAPRYVRGARQLAAKQLESVKDITIGDASFFDAPVVEIDGVAYSLNAFERKFVFAGYDHTSGKPVPKDLDPRAHFALVCGARGCPPLQPRVYRGDSLNSELDRVTREALANPRHLRWEPAIKRLEASQIFAWYPADFGGANGAFAFVLKHVPAAMRAEIEAAQVKAIAGWLQWDWRLNEVEVRKSSGAASP